MKNLLLVLALFSAPAFAVDENSSWDEIRSANVDVDAPKIRFQNWFVQVFDTCVSGDDIHSTSTVRECTKWEHRRNGDRCKEWQEVALSTPRTVTETICEKWGGQHGENCLKERTYTRVLPLSYNVKVYRRSGGDRDRRPTDLLFTKAFDIPACQ